MTQTSNHDAIKSFITAMIDGFRKPNESEDSVKRLLGMFREHLAEFDAATLDAARVHLIRNRKDPFMPTIGECVEACEAAKCGKLALLLEPGAYAKYRAYIASEIRRIKAI